MPQKGIFIGEHINNSAVFFEFTLRENSDFNKLKQELLLLNALNNQDLNVVLCFGQKTLSALGYKAPNELKSFTEIKGVNDLKMPATQSDILIWAHSKSKSEIFDFGEVVSNQLFPLLNLVLKEEGFKYKDSRDLLGFIDGSANPKGIDKRKLEALIPEGMDYENGSFVLVQKWVHKITDFKTRPLKEQEEVIGRTRKNSIELEGEAMPNNSHVSRTDIKVKDEAMKIFRRSYPYTNKEESGLFFLAFAKK